MIFCGFFRGFICSFFSKFSLASLALFLHYLVDMLNSVVINPYNALFSCLYKTHTTSHFLSLFLSFPISYTSQNLIHNFKLCRETQKFPHKITSDSVVLFFEEHHLKMHKMHFEGIYFCDYHRKKMYELSL